MISSKQARLKPLLESTNGIHISIYVPKDEGAGHAHAFIRDAVALARKHLMRVMEERELEWFLKPLVNLCDQPEIIEGFQTHFAIFRSPWAFQLVKIPIEIEYSCSVASSFHVKPLLKWMQTDRECLVLDFENEVCRIYQAGRLSWKSIQELPYAPVNELVDRTEINDFLLKNTSHPRPPIFLCGRKEIIEGLSLGLNYDGLRHFFAIENTPPSRLEIIKNHVSRTMQREELFQIDSSLAEYQFAEQFFITRSDLKGIAKAAVQGKVRKLIIAEDQKIFGKLNPLSGEIKVHPFDLDHEDDDLLDDIAQVVLKKGGSVIVSKKKDIFEGHPALAILNFESEVELLALARRRGQDHRTYSL